MSDDLNLDNEEYSRDVDTQSSYHSNSITKASITNDNLDLRFRRSLTVIISLLLILAIISLTFLALKRKRFVKDQNVEFVSFEKRGRVKAVIFDWGGTVVDCGVCAPILTYVELFRDEGVEITEDEARAPMGSKSRVHIGKILEKEAVIKRWREAKGGQNPTEADVDRMVAKFIPQVLSSLQKYSNVIDGVAETVATLRKNPYNLRIGSTTGYPEHVLKVLLNASSTQGFTPDASVCLSEVPEAKPSPFMLWVCATRLAVYPIEAIVKVDDSVNGIHEGTLAGCWTVGIAKTSSYVGLTEQQLEEVDNAELTRRMNRAYKHLISSGAHYVIDTIRDLPLVINDINRRLISGEKP
ncbi:phosphonoacetaldehyde hydrolase-like protein [Dinothrombium tinctorium]|uniref:Phosphonoacetaldehyde hydrolase-like protein n=1 Tax=Dinothrombium tinctorium TaxID=1965070 RepID=A0A3S3NIX8_9ACAR|nr:phosphonoacetaldehyde hydrolase-like protein [Dinothrombium tinctorium]